MQQPEVKFGEWIEKGFNLYKDNFGLIFPAALVAVVLAYVTLGILAGPMFVGLILMLLRLIDGDETKPEIGDIFKGFDQFVQSFLYILVWALIVLAVAGIGNMIPCIGPILVFAGVVVLKTLIVFGLFLLAEHKMEFWPASMKSIDKVKQNLLPFVGFTFVVMLIAMSGSILCGIGALFTMPLAFCVFAVAYRDVFAGEDGDVSDSESASQPPAIETPAEPAQEESAEAAAMEETAEEPKSDE